MHFKKQNRIKNNLSWSGNETVDDSQGNSSIFEHVWAFGTKSYSF